ncbi:Uu.00g119930.m01.CDS01 [Anthostomella pinea]|uniref:Uu.00g119930.m01.CDS01 n=1 Tax=Anthostomella pinea TaxID=933095 RepID=A0AAI8VHQ5_9PEZI|nr:Uu.00g119930.m01.CDS01 [Anthostomella pinea]
MAANGRQDWANIELINVAKAADELKRAMQHASRAPHRPGVRPRGGLSVEDAKEELRTAIHEMNRNAINYWPTPHAVNSIVPRSDSAEAIMTRHRLRQVGDQCLAMLKGESTDKNLLGQRIKEFIRCILPRRPFLEWQPRENDDDSLGQDKVQEREITTTRGRSRLAETALRSYAEDTAEGMAAMASEELLGGDYDDDDDDDDEGEEQGGGNENENDDLHGSESAQTRNEQLAADIVANLIAQRHEEQVEGASDGNGWGFPTQQPSVANTGDDEADSMGGVEQT